MRNSPTTILLVKYSLFGIVLFTLLFLGKTPSAEAVLLTPADCPAKKPLDLVLVMDDSTSMTPERRNAAVAAAKTAVDTIIDFHPGNKIGIAFMNNSGDDQVALISDKTALKAVIDKLSDEAGTTPTIETIVRAKGMLDLADPKGDIIVFFTDGGCNQCGSQTVTQIRDTLIAGLTQTHWDKLIVAGIGVDISSLQVNNQPAMNYVKALVTDDTKHAKNATQNNLNDIFNDLVKQLMGGGLVDPDGDNHWPDFCAKVTDNLCKHALFGNRPCDDKDNENKYVNPDIKEGLCVNAQKQPTACTGLVTQGVWRLGTREYANCTDYYTNWTDDPTKVLGDIDCTKKTDTGTTKTYYVCAYNATAKQELLNTPAYLSADAMRAASAIPIDNNQLPGGNEGETSCPKGGGIVNCGRYSDDPFTVGTDESQPCGFCHFFQLFDRILKWVVLVIVPAVSVFIVVLGGFMLMVSRGNPEKATLGKNAIIYTFVGYAVMFVGWLVLNSAFAGIGMKKWTGLVPKGITIQKTYGKLLWTPNTDLIATRDELEGSALTIQGTGNKALDGQTRKIVKVWQEGTVGPNTTIDCPDGDSGDVTGTPAGGTTKDCIEVDTALPNVSDIGANGKVKIGGWWQFSCGQ